VFVAQKKLIGLCNIAGKPVICATQMLESMIKNPRPTRAEISDVGNAIMDGADSVMLSGETAKGNYPVEAVKEMHEACLVAENSIPYILHFLEMCNLVSRPVSAEEACAMSAVRTSLDVDAGAIIVLSATGETARLISKYRPTCPILMVTRNPKASRYSHLSRGIYPFIYERPNVHPKGDVDQWQADVDGRVKWAITQALDAKLVRRTDLVVVVQGWKSGAGHTNMVRVLTPEAEAVVLAQVIPS
jgi:pyruvate kinase